MAELRFVTAAQYSPTQCALCLAHAGPFIDTGVEFVGYGHVYICASNESRSGCVRQMGRLDQMLDASVVSEATQQLAELRERVKELELELQESKVVPMSEVLTILREHQPVPAGKES